MGLVNNQRAYDKHLLWQGGEGNIVVGDSVVGFRFPVRIPTSGGITSPALRSSASP